MKKIISIALAVITAVSFSSCVPQRVETEEQKRTKEAIVQEMAELEKILEKSRDETTEITGR